MKTLEQPSMSPQREMIQHLYRGIRPHPTDDISSFTLLTSHPPQENAVHIAFREGRISKQTHMALCRALNEYEDRRTCDHD
jgi:hypothetical protein